MRVRNPDPAVNSLSYNIRIRRICQYSDPLESPDSRIRIKRVKGEEEKSTLVCRRQQSADECRRDSRGEECARVYVLVDDRSI